MFIHFIYLNLFIICTLGVGLVLIYILTCLINFNENVKNKNIIKIGIVFFNSYITRVIFFFKKNKLNTFFNYIFVLFAIFSNLLLFVPNVNTLNFFTIYLWYNIDKYKKKNSTGSLDNESFISVLVQNEELQYTLAGTLLLDTGIILTSSFFLYYFVIPSISKILTEINLDNVSSPSPMQAH